MHSLSTKIRWDKGFFGNSREFSSLNHSRNPVYQLGCDFTASQTGWIVLICDTHILLSKVPFGS